MENVNIDSRRYVSEEKCIFVFGQKIGKQLIVSNCYYGENSQHVVDTQCCCGNVRPVNVLALKNNKNTQCKKCASVYDNDKLKRLNKKSRIAENGLKVCPKCEEVLPVTNFGFDKYTQDKYRFCCKKCERCNWLKKSYGITIDDYESMVLKQNNKCAICLLDVKDVKLLNDIWYVDHDHLTGKIRGLLCRKCNAGIGQFEDSITKLESAIKYLRET